MKFDKIDMPFDGEARRDAKRTRVSIICDVRQGNGGWLKLRLEDLSQSGFKMGWFPGARLHLPLWIRIPGLQFLQADIRWKRLNSLGCSFSQPLHVSVFEHIVREADKVRPYGSLPPR